MAATVPEDLRSFVCRAPRRFFIAALWEGFVAPWEGVLFLCRRPALWRHAIWPLLVNIVLSFVAVVALYFGVTALLAVVGPALPAGWLGGALYWAAALGLALLALGVILCLWIVVGMALCALAYGKLVEKTERELGLDPSQIRPLSPWKEVTDAVRLALRVGLINAALLLFHLIPGIGSVVALVLGTTISSYYFGLEYWDYPLSLRGSDFVEKRRFASRHRFHTMGVGLAVLLMGLVPFVGGVVLTTVVVGATLLHRRLADI